MDAADIQKHMRGHLIAFVAILVLSLVAAASVYFGAFGLSGALAIAGVQVLIISNRMMHAFKDGPWVRGVLFFAALFVVVLLGLTSLGLRSTIEGTEHFSTPVAEPAGEEAH